MKYSIICSKKDMAGMNIFESLIRLFPFKKNGMFLGNEIYCHNIGEKSVFIYTLNEDTVYFETAEKDIDANYFIFATRHQSKSGEKTLSVHVPGNFSEAQMGGKDKEFSTAAASLMKDAFVLENELGKDLGFNITMEATHHGPLIRKPVMFIEIGSKEEEWKNKKAADIIAKVIVEAIIKHENKKIRVAIAFGGLHYCSNFNKVERGSDIAITHVCPKYNLQYLTKEIIGKMIAASDQIAELALIDWKGIPGQEKQKLVSLLDEIGLPWEKVK